MPENDNELIKVNTHLFRKQVNKITEYSKENNYTSLSALHRDIVDFFFNPKNKPSVKRMALTFLGYPIVLCIIFLYAALSTQNLMEILVLQGTYFDELYILSRIFTVLSFGALSWLCANIYILKKKAEG